MLMGKLTTFDSGRFNRQNLKEVLNKIKKGAQIGVLSATLAAGFLMGCSTSVEMDNVQSISGPVKPENAKEPYTEKVGAYTLYAAQPYEFYAVTMEEARAATDYYIAEAGNYTKKLANDFENSLADRPNDKIYLDGLFGGANGVKYSPAYNAENIDELLKTNPEKYRGYFYDIVSALDAPAKRGTFFDTYMTMTDEAYLAGHRADRGDRISQLYNNHKKDNIDYWNMNRYFKEHADLPNAYDTKDFTEVVNLMDTLVQEALPTMNARHNTTVTIQDMRQMINLAFADFSLASLHTNSLSFLGLGHNDNYTVEHSRAHYQMISNAIKEIYAEEQQGLSR